MKVRELIEKLQDQDQDADVHFQYNYGDHWNTQVAPAVEDVAARSIVFSDYHRMPKIVDRHDRADGRTRAVVLS